METMITMASIYLAMGLLTMQFYMMVVGRMIAKKYDCELTEGIARFERAGNASENLTAVLHCVLIWPKILHELLTKEGMDALKEMVNENDY